MLLSCSGRNSNDACSLDEWTSISSSCCAWVALYDAKHDGAGDMLSEVVIDSRFTHDVVRFLPAMLIDAGAPSCHLLSPPSTGSTCPQWFHVSLPWRPFGMRFSPRESVHQQLPLHLTVKQPTRPDLLIEA